MNSFLTIKPQEKCQFNLAVTKNSLVILNTDLNKVIEVIVKGEDKESIVIATNDQDAFLDVISLIKRTIVEDKVNPLPYILIACL